jgi:hypothetical protein
MKLTTYRSDQANTSRTDRLHAVDRSTDAAARMVRLFSAGVAAALAGSSTLPAWADEPLGPPAVMPASADGFFAAGEGGWSHLVDKRTFSEGSPNSAGPQPGLGVQDLWGDGYAVGARLGYQWGPWRLEEEAVFRDNPLSQALDRRDDERAFRHRSPMDGA